MLSLWLNLDLSQLGGLHVQLNDGYTGTGASLSAEILELLVCCPVLKVSPN